MISETELVLWKRLNDVILINQNELQLLNDICSTIIEYGGYDLSLICFHDVMNDNNIIPIASSWSKIIDPEFINPITLHKYFNNCMSSSIKNGKTIVSTITSDADIFKQNLETANFSTHKKCYTVPLTVNNRFVGTISVLSSDINSFDKSNLEIVERIVKNTGRAVEHLRREKRTEEINDKDKDKFNTLSIVYNINKLLRDETSSFTNIITNAVELIPKYWSNMNQFQTSITFDKEKFYSTNYKEPAIKLVSNKYTFDGKLFSLEISLESSTTHQINFEFTEEQKKLIEVVTDFFILYFNKQNQSAISPLDKESIDTVINNTTVGHLLLDSDFVVQSFNEAMALAYPLITGRNLIRNALFFDVIIPERRQLLRNIFEQVKLRKEPYKYEVNFMLDNEMQYFTTSIVPILSLDQISGYSISIYDITRIRNMVLERERIINDLSERNRDLEQFSYIVSHNIRSPLATLLGFSNILKQSLNENEKKTVYLGIEQSAQKLDEIIKDVNAILNVKENLSLAKVNLNLNIIFLSVLASLNDKIKTSNAIIDYDFSKISVINSISPYLHSIFFNLTSNAIKYAKSDQLLEIKVWSEVSDKYIMIYFRDNGRGIDLTKHKEQVFGLYKRFNYDVEGKGMGLFMVKTQIQALNGRIEVESEPNEGTLFKISLPL